MTSAISRGTSAVRFYTTLFIAVTLSLSFAVPAFAISITDGMAATLVLGQPDFTSSSSSTSQIGMRDPTGVAVDPTTGKVFVSDYSNNRVLRFASACSLVNGAAAEGVLGQANFTSGGSALTQSGMNHPASVFVDSIGRLWVADQNNGRVLRFDNAASKANGANADGVLGQVDFTSHAFVTTQSGMPGPVGVFVDSAGRLWVVDQNVNRVLRFDSAASKANGANADGVLGQPNFTSNAIATTQSGMNMPWGVFVDSTGRLWVADESNSRILRFDNAAGKANGANADGVLGQPDFTSHAFVTTQSGMDGPQGLSGDATGRLYVADTGNSRVLIFDNAASKSNGGNADHVLGQTNFTSNSSDSTAATLFDPLRAFFDPAADVLWVPDINNDRVLMYGTPTCISGTIGTEITIPGSGFGQAKGKVLIGNVSTKVLEWTDSFIRCQLLKSLIPGTYNVTIQPKGLPSFVIGNGFTVEAPEIDSADPTSGSAGDEIGINGLFFGTKKGKVTLGGNNCKVLNWKMNPETGESEIHFLIPNGLSSGTQELKVTNGVGSDTINFSLQ